MSAESLAGQMRTAAAAFLAGLDGGQLRLAARPFADDAARRWLDRKEQWRRGRHSGDYWVSVYGDPEGGQP